MNKPVILAGLLCSAIAVAGWQNSNAAETSGRYVMSPADGGVVRLDTLTGAMALCANKDGSWSCRDIAESSDTVRKRLEALERENQSLKDEVRRLESTAVTPPEDGPKSFAMPDEKDVDKAFDYVESMIRKFRDRIKKLEEQDGTEGGTPL